MALRFSGLVKAARHFRERMLAGVEPGEREEFLASARRIVDDVEKACREDGSSIDDLPCQSRDAVARLREIALISPDQLPAPSVDRQSPKRICVTNVVRNLDDALATLARPDLTDERAEDVVDSICHSVLDIEMICREGGSAPGAMPQRSAKAYAMLKWLSHGENFERYLGLVRIAQEPFEAASRKLWPDSTRKVRVMFTPGKHLWKARVRADIHAWCLAAGYLNASAEDIEELARAAATRKRGKSPTVAFAESPDFHDMYRELNSLLEGGQYDPKGREWDLDELFTRVNARFFGGALARPHLTWNATPSSGRFGTYDSMLDVVSISAVLDDPELPEYVPAFVMYHELLHKKHGYERAGSRRRAHTQAFFEDERRFPERERAQRCMEELACAKCGSPIVKDGTRSRRVHIPTPKPERVPHRAAGTSPVAPPMPADLGVMADLPQRTSATPLEGNNSHRVGRNAPCPCGSGRKYKKCCGR